MSTMTAVLRLVIRISVYTDISSSCAYARVYVRVQVIAYVTTRHARCALDRSLARRGALATTRRQQASICDLESSISVESTRETRGVDA